MDTKDIKNVILDLSEAFDSEARKETSTEVVAAMNIPWNWKDPDEINCMYMFPLTRHVDFVVEKKYPELNKNMLSRVQFIYQNYNFLSNNISNMASLGVGCDSDMSRWIISSYIKHCSGESIIIPEKRSYYHPSFGTMEDWIKYVEELMNVYSGHISNFISSESIAVYLTELRNEKLKQMELETKAVYDYYNDCYLQKLQEFYEMGVLTDNEKKRMEEKRVSIILLFTLVNKILDKTLDDETLLQAIKNNIKNAFI